MADSASILAIVNGSIGLAVKLGTVAQKLYSLSQQLKYAELTLRSLASECETIQVAWDSISAWAKQQPSNYDGTEKPLLERLKRSLLSGTMVLSALEDDLNAIGAQSPGLFRRNKIVWNEASFARHQDRVRGQVAAMTLLLLVIQLPSPAEQTDLLVREDEVLRESDETAWTIVDSTDSYSIRHPNARASLESSDTVSVTFDFEPELMTGRVYGRSYKYLAKRILSKKAGKQPIRDIRASLIVRRGDKERDLDEESVLTVSRRTITRQREERQMNSANHDADPPSAVRGAWVDLDQARTIGLELQEDYIRESIAIVGPFSQNRRKLGIAEGRSLQEEKQAKQIEDQPSSLPSNVTIYGKSGTSYQILEPLHTLSRPLVPPSTPKFPPIRRTPEFGIGFGSRHAKPIFSLEDEDEYDDSILENISKPITTVTNLHGSLNPVPSLPGGNSSLLSDRFRTTSTTSTLVPAPAIEVEYVPLRRHTQHEASSATAAQAQYDQVLDSQVMPLAMPKLPEATEQRPFSGSELSQFSDPPGIVPDLRSAWLLS